MPAFCAEWVSVHCRLSCWLVLALAATLSTVRAGDGIEPARDKLNAAQEEFFESRIRPVLADNCLECHGAEKHKGGLRLDIRPPCSKGARPGRPSCRASPRKAR